MNKQQIAALLEENHAKFVAQLEAFSDEDLHYAPEGKWSAIQQLDHICRSVAPVNLALWLPKFIVRRKFGLANRPSKTYDQLIEKYKRKLTEGGRAPGPFVPAPASRDSKKLLFERIGRLVQKLARRTRNHSEEALDKYILPHPLLGKLTYREILYFTAYHVQHHGEMVRKGLESK